MDLVRKAESDIKLHKLLFASPPLNVYKLQKEKNEEKMLKNMGFPGHIPYHISAAHASFTQTNSFNCPHFLGLLLFFSLPFLISFLPKELFLTAATPAVK